MEQYNKICYIFNNTIINKYIIFYKYVEIYFILFYEQIKIDGYDDAITNINNEFKININNYNNVILHLFYQYKNIIKYNIKSNITMKPSIEISIKQHFKNMSINNNFDMDKYIKKYTSFINYNLDEIKFIIKNKYHFIEYLNLLQKWKLYFINNNIIQQREYNNETDLIVCCGNIPLTIIDVMSDLENYIFFHSHKHKYTIDINYEKNPWIICDITWLLFIKDLEKMKIYQQFKTIIFEGCFITGDNIIANIYNLLKENGICQLNNNIYVKKNLTLLLNDNIVYELK